MPTNHFTKNKPARKPFLANPALVKKYLAQWKKLDKSRVHADALTILFREQFPLNNSIEQVLIKVSALNDFYATRILDTFSIASHVVKLKIDKDLNRGNLDLVDKLRFVKRKTQKVNLYSFASKYCGMHRPDLYPMWDSYVDRMLRAYRKKHKFASFINLDLRNYKRFVEVMKEFQIHYQLQEFTLRELDAFLWLYGKKCFPRKIYNKR
jgi:hypothetical protein